MKVLTVTTGNILPISPFITDHVKKLSEREIQVEYFLVKGKGLVGYLKNFTPLDKKIKEFKPDVIHAHYGLSGLLCSLQRKIPVVTTFHGSDINLPKVRFFSKIAHHLSHSSIFVSKELADLINAKHFSLIPCGVDFKVFKPQQKELARKRLNLDSEKRYILFSSSFTIPVKNYPLAKKALEYIEQKPVEMIELKGYSRAEVAILMNAVDLCLMTSISEGSPQFIKEALACNTPIVATNVGDVSILLKDIKDCYVCDPEPKKIAEAIERVFADGRRTDSRQRIGHLDAEIITEQIIMVYKNAIGLNNNSN